MNMKRDSSLRFYEEKTTALSNRDRDRLLGLLDSPPAPNANLERAAKKYTKSYG